MFKKYSFLFLCSLFFFSSCSDKELDPVVSLNSAPVITSPNGGTDFLLLEEEGDNGVGAFTWNAADFGYDAAVTYSLDVDASGNNFANSFSLGSTNELEIADMTVALLNNILLAQGLPANFENPLEMRVCASVSERVEQLCSEAVMFTANPFPAEINFPKLGVPGMYQDWNEKNEETVIFSRGSNTFYDGFLYFTIDSCEYKFIKDFSWDTNWGDDGLDGTLDPGTLFNNLKAPGLAGMYFLSADIGLLQHTIVATNWGVLGDATPTGTSEDTDLVWDEERSVLSVTLDLNPGNLRFRANDAEDIKFGDDFGNGTLEFDGEEILIEEAGNYTIDLLLDVAQYTYTITKN